VADNPEPRTETDKALWALLQRSRVEVPGFEGQELYVNELMLGDAMRIYSAPLAEQQALSVSLCLRDAHGLPLLTPEQAGRLPQRVAGPILEAINRVNGLSDEAVEAATGN